METATTFWRLKQATWIVVRLSMIVSLWQAPIPWIHCHGTDVRGIQSVETASELSHHLAAFHASGEVGLIRIDDDLGWHFHWILPCWGHAADQTPEDQPPAEECTTFDQVTVSANPSTLDLAIGLDSYLNRLDPKPLVARPTTPCRVGFLYSFFGTRRSIRPALLAAEIVAHGLPHSDGNHSSSMYGCHMTWFR